MPIPLLRHGSQDGTALSHFAFLDLQASHLRDSVRTKQGLKKYKGIPYAFDRSFCLFGDGSIVKFVLARTYRTSAVTESGLSGRNEAKRRGSLVPALEIGVLM